MEGQVVQPTFVYSLVVKGLSTSVTIKLGIYSKLNIRGVKG